MRDIDTRVERTRSVGDVEAPRSSGEAMMRAWGERAGERGPLTRALIREHCRGAKSHVEWARQEEHMASLILDDDEGVSPRDADDAAWHATRGSKDWLEAVAHVLRALAILALLAPTVAAAQSDEVMTLRTCISERGFRTDVDDCVIVVEVVRARMERRGGSYAENLRALAPHLLGSPCNVSRRWLCDIDADCHRPRGLVGTWTTPRGDEPSRYEACVETVAEVRALLASEASRCEERPAHWGSRSDVARRIAAGFRWRDAECPGLVLLNRAGFLYRRAS